MGDLAVALRSLLRRRFSGEPVQYILGAWEFYGREFLLTRDTLIPRPETEGLVEGVVDAWRKEKRGAGRMLDVGTGCGAIAVTLAAELPREGCSRWTCPGERSPSPGGTPTPWGSRTGFGFSVRTDIPP